MKSLFMVAYHYPPEGASSGVLRTLKFSKYLPRHGWAPHVLTLRETFYPFRDDGLLRDVPPEAVIHRTRGFDISRHLAIKGHYPALLTVPDRFVSWVPFGVARALRVVRRSGIRALYSTSPPPTAHLIAAAVKRATGLPWIADFRDPWIEDGLYPTPGSLRYRVESRLERIVVRWADRLTVTTPYLRGDFLDRYPDLAPDKVRVIFNGYDEEDFSGLEPPTRSSRFEILHAGLVPADYRDPAPLLEAVASLIGEGRISRDLVRITFLGAGKYLQSPAFSKTVQHLGLDPVVQVPTRIPNRAIPRRLRQASCLLLLQASDDTRSLIPAKAFEYLRTGQPILALTLEGATSDLLKEMEHCVAVSPSDHTRLRDVVAALYREWQESSAPIWVDRPVQRFERAALTSELAGILDDLVRGQARG